MPRRVCRSAESGFDFTAATRRLCGDMVCRTPELSHVDIGRVLVAGGQARNARRFGVLATMTPLRFAGGSRFEVRRGQTWTIERVHDGDGREMLYLLRFFLPRFLDHPLEEKLTTVFHELWHIGPEFDGDLRRHEGRCWAHSASQAQFDAGARRLADAWLAQDPPKELYAFLQMSFEQLQAAHGRVIGLSVRPPRLVRVPQPAAADRA